MTHEFQQSLEASEGNASEEYWLDIYRQYFGDILSVNAISSDGWAQRGGVDKIITLSSGRQICVDEKYRDKWYGDILLEYWSSKEHKTKGWVAKDLLCEYIAYLVIPEKKCYMLPFYELRRAWRENHKEWVKRYKKIEAKNKGYTTVSVGVPLNVLYAAMNREISYNF